ncbi:HET-domain-containing protein [Stipitochalara longipes BDJ]|nr:HET-domain-containing protein [Stipitochalara longipes BDJ]
MSLDEVVLLKAEEGVSHLALDNNSHEIRILEFHASDDEPFEIDSEDTTKPHFWGKLKHVSLIDTEPYTALSYCWGSPGFDKRLRLGNRTSTGSVAILITDNLHSALRALWERRGDKKTLRVWVDAVCINQNDLYERSQQVQMMRQIYARAQEVIAWVGPTASSSLSSTDLNSLWDETLASEETWKIWKAFFNEEYWTRVWIIQEITVASKVTMLYGGLKFSWEVLVLKLTSLLTQFDKGRTDRGSEASEIGASHILKFREHWMDSEKPISLFQAMTWTLHTKATDPRDKIFALLGLCHDGFRLVPIPNYKQSLGSIISEMSRLSFSRNRSLDLMCLRGTSERLEEDTSLPTWVPNWPVLWSSGRLTAQEKMILRSPTSFNFDPVLATSTNSVLKVEARYICTITAISSALKTSTQKASSQHASKSSIFTNEKIQNMNVADYISLSRSSLWRTLTMNCSGFDNVPKEMDECFSNLWTPQGRGSIYNTRIIDWLDENASFKVLGETLKAWSQLEPQGVSESRSSWSNSLFSKARNLGAGQLVADQVTAWDTTNTALEQVLGSGMRLAELSPEILIPTHVALVNPQTESSDQVFILRGCSTPVVLRLVESSNIRYEVIGGVWLHDKRGRPIEEVGVVCDRERATGSGELKLTQEIIHREEVVQEKGGLNMGVVNSVTNRLDFAHNLYHCARFYLLGVLPRGKVLKIDSDDRKVGHQGWVTRHTSLHLNFKSTHPFSITTVLINKLSK